MSDRNIRPRSMRVRIRFKIKKKVLKSSVR